MNLLRVAGRTLHLFIMEVYRVVLRYPVRKDRNSMEKPDRGIWMEVSRSIIPVAYSVVIGDFWGVCPD